MSLMDLVREWEHSARRRFMDAKNKEGAEKRALEDGAMIYFNCARELSNTLFGDDILGNMMGSIPAGISERITKVRVKYILDKPPSCRDILDELARRRLQGKWDLSGLSQEEVEILLKLADKVSSDKPSAG